MEILEDNFEIVQKNCNRRNGTYVKSLDLIQKCYQMMDEKNIPENGRARILQKIFPSRSIRTIQDMYSIGTRLKNKGLWSLAILQGWSQSRVYKNLVSYDNDLPIIINSGIKPRIKKEDRVNGCQKLTVEEVKEIKSIKGLQSKVRDVAEEYEVSKSVIYDIMNGNKWREV